MRAIPETIEDLVENPTKFGMPTFEEFIRNKKKWMGSKEDWLESIDAGDPVLKLTQRYYVEHYRVESLEQAERIALDMGFNLYDDFVLDPQIVQDGGRHVSEVKFRSKRALEKRANW